MKGQSKDTSIKFALLVRLTFQLSSHLFQLRLAACEGSLPGFAHHCQARELPRNTGRAATEILNRASRDRKSTSLHACRNRWARHAGSSFAANQQLPPNLYGSVLSCTVGMSSDNKPS